ncbi:hypothetical protein ACG1VR_10560 [Cedecea davisae]|uniref:hypothetical protein n=1 Tax=Cedecea davisae TaxID=158484 RepID=UPI00376F2727
MHNLPLHQNNVTNIDSQSLLAMVNDARRQCGEPEVRNNKFIEKIEDELEGEFYTKSAKPSGISGGRPVEVIDMSIKQALRVAARESKAVRRALVDRLEDMQAARPASLSQNEIIAAMAVANVEQDRRIHALEKQVNDMAQGAIPAGYQGYSYLSGRTGLSDRKCRQLVAAYDVEHKTVPHVAPTGAVTRMTVVLEQDFMDSFNQMVSEAERRGCYHFHAAIGKFMLAGGLPA